MSFLSNLPISLPQEGKCYHSLAHYSHIRNIFFKRQENIFNSNIFIVLFCAMHVGVMHSTNAVKHGVIYSTNAVKHHWCVVQYKS